MCTVLAYDIWKTEGEFLNLMCATRSSLVEWRKGRVKIFASGRMSFQHNLVIVRAALSDSDVYSCNDFDTGDNIVQYNVRVKGKTRDNLSVVD